ncbi:3-oxoacyl-ACP synthase III family protein [Saccharothrix syringae]|uniref:Ketoacyl-ACP synthase III n=1 Tax=Saccharothrix syringae TaxID=103733 RepID=A0A5Q0GYY2_SACSY|nr:ketoacyl-ACP synthase III [Saccharothrix syringae]QFZ18734.1 ketoacyl-ACP synthase III [Saccharothrix syringae]
MSTRAIGLLGTGSYLPERVVTNEEVAAMTPDATAEWILRKTAISTRRWAAEDEATSDLAAGAARAALEHAGLPVDRVDYLIVSTSTGDFPQPPTAGLVQQLIGARNAACLDINTVCAGFVYGLELARGLVATHPGARVLVVAADLYSRILDFDDRRTCVLLGDGAGAAVVGEVPEGRGILDIDLGTNGEHQDLIKVNAGGSRVPTSARTLADGGHFFTMQGRGVRDFVFDNVPPAIDKLLTSVSLGADQVDFFVPHQANGVLLDELVVRCGLTRAHTAKTVEQYGNVGSASVPVALDHIVKSGRVRPDDLLVLSAFGGGMSTGHCVIRWSGAGGAR